MSFVQFNVGKNGESGQLQGLGGSSDVNRCVMEMVGEDDMNTVVERGRGMGYL